MKALLIAILLVLASCSKPILKPDEYITEDTVYTSTNGFGVIMGYDVIIRKREDSLLRFGHIVKDVGLTWISPRAIKIGGKKK